MSSMNFFIQLETAAPFELSVPDTYTIGQIKEFIAPRVGKAPATFELLDPVTFNPIRDDLWVSKLTNRCTLFVRDVPTAPVVSPAAAHTTASATVASLAPKSTVATATASSTTATMAADVGEECTICLECFVPSVPAVVLKCKHGFHETCIREWSKSSAFCPLCRRPIEIDAPAATAASTGVPTASTPTAVITVATGAPQAPPTKEEVAKILLETRDRILRSTEYQTALKAIKDFRNSRAVQAGWATASAVGSAAVTTGGDLLKTATHNLVHSNFVTKGLASALGFGGKAAPATMVTTTVVPAGAPIVIPGGSSRVVITPTYGAPTPTYMAAPAPTFVTPPAPTFVRCPTCHQVIQPPAGADLFRCPCGTALRR